MNVIKPSIPMRSNPDENSELETECLFGETLEILDKYTDWYYCKLLTDNYHGWVKKKYLGKFIPPTHRIISKTTFIYKEDDVKSGCINYLPLGAQVFVKKIYKSWAKICLSDPNYKSAYIPRNHIIKIGENIIDWVAIAEKLIGTPYVWGGRNSIGLDCSALLQLSYQTYGENIPRNSNEQAMLKKEIIENELELKRGYIVFWKGHVGIMADKYNCVHANAFHMEVSKEPLKNIVKRASKDNPIIKIMNFN